MATSEWIESAAREDRRHIGPGSGFTTRGDHLLAMAAHDQAAAQLERTRAIRFVRRLAPDDAAGLLAILGLDDAPAPGTPDTTTKRCRRCHHDRPATDFYRDGARSDGLSSYCKRCKRAMALDAHRRRKEDA